MLAARLVPELLMRLHDSRLADPTLKAFINVINALMGHKPSEEDVRRYEAVCIGILAPMHLSDSHGVWIEGCVCSLFQYLHVHVHVYLCTHIAMSVKRIFCFSLLKMSTIS